jgi:hypothetical protein
LPHLHEGKVGWLEWWSAQIFAIRSALLVGK